MPPRIVLFLLFALPSVASRAERIAPAEKLLWPGQVGYSGAFKLPQDAGGASRFGYGGQALAYRPAGNAGKGSLYVAGHEYDQKIAEVTVPGPVISKHWRDLATASQLGDFTDVSQGLKNRIPDARIGGLWVAGPNLFWSFYKFYNVDGENLPHMGVSNDELRDLDARGLWSFAGQHMQRTAGYITAIPQAWRRRFGSSFLAGLSRPQGRATTSEGPAAFRYGPWQSGDLPVDGAQLRTKAFLAYDVAHPVTYRLDGSLRTWKGSDGFHGMVFLQSADGTRAAVVAVMRLGTYREDWYGEPDEFPGPACDGGKGYHGGPYVTELWFYDPEAMLLAAKGERAPWSLRPYARKALSDRWFDGECRYLGGVGYDTKSRRLFLAEPNADRTNEYEAQPVIHILAHE